MAPAARCLNPLRSWRAAALWLAAVAGAIAVLQALPWSLKWNASPSMPRGLYFAVRYDGSALGRGEAVVLEYRSPGWAKGRYYPEATPLAKTVMAVPGDVLVTRGNSQFACPAPNECRLLGEALLYDRAGRPTRFPAWTGYVVQPGEYYVGSTHSPYSYDSRYFGLVRSEQIRARIYPFVTFD